MVPTSVERILKGKVKRWVGSRGYGFIEAENGEDVFVHHSDIGGLYELKEGQKVEFKVDKKDKRPRASNVKVVS